VLFARQFFAEIDALKSDMGARPLLSRYGNLVQEVEIDDHAVSLDISRQ
jgi:CTP:molybdopterin cytidylyltransferase MocA